MNSTHQRIHHVAVGVRPLCPHRSISLGHHKALVGRHPWEATVAFARSSYNVKGPMHVHALGHLSTQRAPFSVVSGIRDEILTLAESFSNLCRLL